MDPGLRYVPDDVTLGAISTNVLKILAKYTVFPWPILKTQASRLNLDPANLRLSDLDQLTEHLAFGVARFTSPQKGEEARQDLQRLKNSF